MSHSKSAETPPAFDEKADDLGEAAQPDNLVFPTERHLEDYLESHLPEVVLPLGLDLLLIGRQIGKQIDLLAVDSAGVIYIIELKLNKVLDSLTTQLLRYRHWVKRQSRGKIIDVAARSGFDIDLEEIFQRRFGHPLPENVNHSQVLMVVAPSIPREVAEAILELQDLDCSCIAFRYDVRGEAVTLSPCCRDDQDVEAGTHLGPSRGTNIRAELAPVDRPPGYRVHIAEDVARYWRTHAEDFGPFVSVAYIERSYQRWVESDGHDGLEARRRQWGNLDRQIFRLAFDSGDWTKVYVPPGLDMREYDTIKAPPTWRKSKCQGHRIVGYLRRPFGATSEP